MKIHKGILTDGFLRGLGLWKYCVCVNIVFINLIEVRAEWNDLCDSIVIGKPGHSNVINIKTKSPRPRHGKILKNGIEGEGTCPGCNFSRIEKCHC